MNNPQKVILLKQEISRSFNKAASSYDESAFLQREVADRLLDRLNYIRIQPEVILDLGSGTGYSSQILEKRYKKSKIIAVDFAEQMLLRSKKAKKWFDRKRYVCADAEMLPFGDNTVDLIFSNLMLHWMNDSEEVLKELRRVLKPNGVFLFSTLGPDTLYELRESWARIDEGIHVHSFLDMHYIGDFLVWAGFVDPVIDMEFITITYNDIKKILIDLKNLGTHNISQQRQKGLMGKEKFTQFIQEYEKFRNPEGLLPVTYEVIYGLGWGHAKEPDEISIPVSEIKKPPRSTSL
jgi:malonyl-CoA O-methyltransferase